MATISSVVVAFAAGIGLTPAASPADACSDADVESIHVRLKPVARPR